MRAIFETNQWLSALGLLLLNNMTKCRSIKLSGRNPKRDSRSWGHRHDLHTSSFWALKKATKMS